MSDLVEEVRACYDGPDQHGVEGSATLVEVRIDLLQRVVKELEHLRGVAGCCTDGPTVADLKKSAASTYLVDWDKVKAKV